MRHNLGLHKENADLKEVLAKQKAELDHVADSKWQAFCDGNMPGKKLQVPDWE